MHLESPAFEDGGEIPEVHTCEGEGTSPPLAWSGVPDETKSFVVLCADPDAPAVTFKHWVLYDLPAEVTELETGVSPDDVDFEQGTNGYFNLGYGPPCPPPGHGSHRYVFRVLALEVESIDVGSEPDYETVEEAAEPHMLAEAELTGTYGRAFGEWIVDKVTAPWRMLRQTLASIVG